MKIKILNLNCKTRDEVLKEISDDAFKNKFVSKPAPLLKAFKEREATGTTGFEDGIAIPHARIPEITETVVYVARIKQGVNWPALDKQKTTVAVGLLVPGNKSAASNHMELLSTVASKLMDTSFKKIIKTGTPASITKALETKEAKPKQSKKVSKDGMNIVGISACATGVAHTYMVQKALQDFGLKNGHNVKIETQGQKGQENKLTDQEIKEADLVIIAADINVELDRFNGKKVFMCTTHDALQDVKKTFDKAKSEAKELKSGPSGNIISTSGRGFLSHVLSGVSRMIPFVVFSGIVWAILNSVGFAYGATKPAELLLAQKSAAVGFTFFIAMMGGFIGESIGGRAAFAPAAIATFVAANPDFYYDWNGVIPPVYMKDLSGNLLKHTVDGKLVPLQLKVGWTIIGAIASGFAAGHLVNIVNKFKVHKLLEPLMPILFIPVAVTSAIVFPIVFVLGAPVGWLINMLGLGLGLGGQVPGVNFLIGFILGAMIGWDMGGPINKIAGSTATALILVDPRLLGAVEAAIPIAPLGCGLASLIGGKTFDKTEKGLGISALALGFFGISEGAIPFAAKRPKQTIFVNTISSALTGGLAFMFFVGGHVGMWGGPIVALVMGVYADPGTLGVHIPAMFGGSSPFISVLWFFVSIAAGMVLHAFLYIYFIRREQKGKKMFPNIKELKFRRN